MHLASAVREVWAVLGKTLLFGGTLGPVLRKSALVRVGVLSKARCEVHHHDERGSHRTTPPANDRTAASRMGYLADRSRMMDEKSRPPFPCSANPA